MFQPIPVYKVQFIVGDVEVTLRVSQDRIEPFMNVLLFNRVENVSMELDRGNQ